MRQTLRLGLERVSLLRDVLQRPVALRHLPLQLLVLLGAHREFLGELLRLFAQLDALFPPRQRVLAFLRTRRGLVLDVRRPRRGPRRRRPAAAGGHLLPVQEPVEFRVLRGENLDALLELVGALVRSLGRLGVFPRVIAANDNGG